MKAHGRPLIGLPVSPPEDGSPYYNLNPEYSDTIRRAGGDPLAFPLIPDPTYACRLIDLIDGLVLIGSAYDLDPAGYGQKCDAKVKEICADRDELDRLLLDMAFKRSLPVLGICHGCQAINVFLGGTLYQDIAGQAPNVVQHRTRSATGEYAHEVILEPGSVLNSMAETIKAQVNSAHDQAIDRLGRGLKVIARADDGLAEAVEHEELERHFVLGVQWHPERLAASDTLSSLVYERLVAAAAAWRAARCDGA